jgi:hypothetical protein
MTRDRKLASLRPDRRMCRNTEALITISISELPDGALLLVLPRLNAEQKLTAHKLPEVRMAAVSAMREARRFAIKGYGGVLRLTDGSTMKDMDRLAVRIGRCYGVSGRTVFRWQRRFRAGGLAALLRKQRSDRGRSRFFSKHPELALAVLQSGATRKERGFSLRTLYRLLSNKCHRAAIHPPSYETLRSFVKAQQ